VKDVDARLMKRLATVNDAMGPVLLLLLDKWHNDLDGGLPPSAEFRGLGEDFTALGGDLIARADEVDAIAQRTQPVIEQPEGGTR
jgi:hypothetical protein